MPRRAPASLSLSAALCALVFATPALAAYFGVPDATFGTSGRTFTNFGAAAEADAAAAVAIQADGRIVSAGSTTPGSGSRPMAIARHSATGSPDGTFGGTGRVTDTVAAGTFLPTTAAANGVAIQSDGKAVVVGTWFDPPINTGAAGTRNFVVSRYTATGTPDVKVMTSLDGHSEARAVRVQGDGKIVAAGYSYVPYTFSTPDGPRRFALARYNADLSLDSGFNATGKVVTPVGTGAAEINAVALQADGKVVAVGYARNATDKDFALARYTAAGALEGSFLTSVGTGTDDTANAVAIQGDGMILVGGSSGANSALLRYSAPGVLDATFASSGRFIVTGGGAIVALAIQPDGKILALTDNFQVWRLTTAGAPDTTFGVAGRVVFAMGAGSAATAMALQADGRIVVAGRANGGAGTDFVVARINPATLMGDPNPLVGSLDFGGQSMNTTSPAMTLTLSNAGNAVTVSTVAPSPGFAVSANNCPVVPVFSGCTILVTYTPTFEGPILGTLLVETAGSSFAVSLKGSGERSLVTHYYRSILRRAPDSGGKAFWESEATRVSGLGANVNETWFAMSQAFYTSAEYASFNRDNTGFATDLYNTFFNRAPDSPGLAFWKDQLDQGLPREVALAAFMFSTEFRTFAQAIFGTATVRAEVDAITDFYRGLLARLPDGAGFNFWIGRFRAAQCQDQAAVTGEVEAISSAFATSGEYTARGRTSAQYVGDLYNAFLRRGGDLAGVQFWINQVATGAQTREQVRVQFRNSPEFQQRVNAIIQQGCSS